MTLLRRSAVIVLLVLLMQLCCTQAFEVSIDNDQNDKLVCGGMFASSKGTNDSDVRVVMNKSSQGNAVVVIFEWNDKGLIGKRDNETGETLYICDTQALKAQLCNEADMGKVIIDTSVASSVQSQVLDFSVEEDQGNQFFYYPIHKTGFYCVKAWPVMVNQKETIYEGHIRFNNHHGALAGSDYPKLPFYGALSLTYAVIGIAWMVLCAKHWREILTVQHFISGVIFFLMVEMAFNWGFWENYNESGEPSMALLVLVSILNSGRNSLSLFMLLIVSMGYGVVKPTLGTTMRKVIMLSLAHFLFGIIYSAGTMSPVDDVSAMIVLMVVVPLSLTMVSFYIWTLQSLTSTITALNVRRQTEKVLMYTRLWRLLVFSLTVLCAFFVINTLAFMSIDDVDWPASHWRIRWFLLDGWLNILYLIVFTAIVILWRPTENNKRYGIDQLETEDYDENDEHADHNNARAAESMGLTGMKLRPQRRDYEIEDDEVARFDIGEEDEDEDDDNQLQNNDDDIYGDNDAHLENGRRPSRLNSGSSSGGRLASGSSREPSPRYNNGSGPILNAALADDVERERRRLEVSKMN
ncbi:hypothetical protein BG006_007923 [Podila minutissima]|uniref:Uncharacterized protein n=1 Tax=Podila minutissima TaxID=64525 RepID=A0A9P5SGU9_9FUNG|nr:hypothetical protein BG006_007923 [Podila minutissima]